jgi:hypothetical protein
MKLPEREHKVMALLDAGKSFTAIDEELGIAEGTSRIYYRSALRTLSREELIKQFPTVAFSMEDRTEEGLGQELVQDAKSAGLPEGVMKQIQKRIAAKRGKLERGTVKPLSHKELVNTLEQKLSMALEYIDDFALSGASAKDLSSTADVLNKNLQLVKGLPTQIVSHAERKKLNELLPALIAEAEKRGVPLKPIDGIFQVEQ